MNTFMIKRLILKDWYLQRWAIAGYLAGSVLALVLLAMGSNPAAFYASTILIITLMIGAGIHLAMVTVLQERTDHTLPFIMTLPISPQDYTMAKILANLSLFLLPGIALTAGTLGLLATPGARNGALIPFATLVLLELFASYCLLLTVAIVTESQGWTVGVMVTLNLFLQGFLYSISHIPSIALGMKGHGAVWSPTVLALLLAEGAAIVIVLAAAFALQARKRDFL
jgi:ABC-2 type transport system permease protein